MSDETLLLFSELRCLVEQALENLPFSGDVGPAARYALFSGGKRMRPLLTMLAAHACGNSANEALPAACAIECLHSASLIWDDMPCMDNATERRGRAAVHVMFGEGIATLAALALLNQAYSVFGRDPGLAAEACECVAGMIDGQTADLQGAVSRRNRKTAALMRLTLTAGAIVCRAPETQIAVLARSGEYIGEAYQIFDDFEDGDAGTHLGAEKMIADAKTMLQDHFGSCVSPLITAIDNIAFRFTNKELAVA